MTWPWELEGGWFVGSAVLTGLVAAGLFLLWAVHAK
jgi:hypothetical protein